MQTKNEKLTIEFFSKAAQKSFFEKIPREVQIAFITQLETKIAYNLSPTIPITHIGDGLIELKINGSPAFRCLYTMKKAGKVVILHTFKKTTNKPDVKNIRLAVKRLKKI